MVPQRKNRGLFPREERDIQSRQNETIGHSQDNYLKFYLSPETILLVPYLPLPTQNSSLLLLYPILQSHQAACFWNMPYFFMSLPLHMLFLISRILAKFLFIFPGISFNCLLLCNKLLWNWIIYKNHFNIYSKFCNLGSAWQNSPSALNIVSAHAPQRTRDL